MTYEHRMAAVVEEGGVVHLVATDGQVASVINSVGFKVTLIVISGLVVTSEMGMVVGNDDRRRAKGGGESDGGKGEEVHGV